MTPQEIRQAIRADQTLTNLLPDSAAIAALLSEGRTRPNGAEIGHGLILATIGIPSGNALLDALYADETFRYVKPLLEQGRLDVSSPLVAGALDALVLGSVITRGEADALIALGREPDPVSTHEVQAAILADDGSLRDEVLYGDD